MKKNQILVSEAFYVTPEMKKKKLKKLKILKK